MRYYGAERGGLALDFAFVFSRVEHVERVVARGLLDENHEAREALQSQSFSFGIDPVAVSPGLRIKNEIHGRIGRRRSLRHVDMQLAAGNRRGDRSSAIKLAVQVQLLVVEIHRHAFGDAQYGDPAPIDGIDRSRSRIRLVASSPERVI